jgi:DNA-binding GntR family transcriptional regulator
MLHLHAHNDASGSEVGEAVSDRAFESRARRTASDWAYGELRRLILSTELRPGQVLVESELMARLGVGRTPLRDSLRLLSHDGLVNIEPRRETTVAPLTSSDLHAIFELRVSIEPLVAEAAVARATQTDLDALAALVVRAERNPEGSSDPEVDEALHRLLVGVSHNRFLIDFYRRLRDESLRFRFMTGSAMDSRDDQVAFLRAVHGCLAARDRAGLTGLLVAHVEDFRDQVWTALTASPANDGGLTSGRDAGIAIDSVRA